MIEKNYSQKFVRFVSTVGPKLQNNDAKDKDGGDIYINEAEIIHIIAKYLGVQYEILTPPDGEYGTRLPDGNWTGMIGMIQREEADVAMGLAVTPERLSDVIYSYPYLYSTVIFMTDALKPLPKNLAIFYPFSYTLWIALILLTVAMSFVFYFLLNRRQPYEKVLLSTVGSTLEKTFVIRIKKPTIKMAAFGWFLSMLVVSNCYKGVLLSFLLFPTMTGIRDISELSRAAAATSFKCFTFPGSYISQKLVKSEDPSWKAIGECLIRNELPGDPLENFAAAAYGKAYVGSKINAVPYDRRYFLSEEYFVIEHYGAALSKTFCCREDLNRVLHHLLAAELIGKTYRDVNFFTVLQKPSLTPDCCETSPVITLGEMSGAFYILIFGWFGGFVVLLKEIFIQKYTK